MASLRSAVPLFTLMSLLLLTFSEARDFVVGGSNCSWAVPIPPGCLNEWAQANRFIVGDTLLFEYYPKFDFVLRVSKEDYESCNRTNPFEIYYDGNTTIELDQSGPFYFIGGARGRCENGQNLTVTVVLDFEGVRHQEHSPPTEAPTLSRPSLEATSIVTRSRVTTATQGGAAHVMKVGFTGILLGVGALVWMVFL